MRTSRFAGARVLSLAALAALLSFAGCSDEKKPGGNDGYGGSSGDGVGGSGTGATGGVTIGTGGSAGVLGGSGGSGAVATDGGCAFAEVKSDRVPAHLLFVVDRTGTMECNPPPVTDSATCQATPVRQNTNQPSKWELLTDALTAAWALLPPETGAGLSFFSNNEVCGVNSIPTVGVNPLDATQLSSLGSALTAIKPGGGTPMIGALVLAYQHLHEEAQNPAKTGPLVGNKFVVLITDGEDNCNTDKIPILPTEIDKALKVNIRTYVIGAPGSENTRALLSQMAFIGGTARDAACDHAGTPPDKGDCHFDMTTTNDFGADLANALTAISGQALSCEFDVPESPDGKPVDLGKVNVRYKHGDGTDENVLQDKTKGCDEGAQGWQYSADNTKIILCGSVCDAVKEDSTAKVEIVLGCQTEVVR